jgi:hypothetical protein
MIPRWFRRESGTDPETPDLNALHPVSAELSEIVETLLVQAAQLESMIARGNGSEDCRGRRDTIVAVLEQASARVADAQLVLNEGRVRDRAR